MDYLIYSVEDDKNIARILEVALKREGYEFCHFLDGNSFLSAFYKRTPNMVLLDMMLPDIQGSEILKTIRKEERFDDVEIIILSANRMVMDKVDGLDLGADDYIEKPFDILELISRINAKVRRHIKNNTITYNNVEIDFDRRSVRKDGILLELTGKEYLILSMLFKRGEKVLTREEIYQALWGQSAVESRTVDMHIKSLRRKLSDSKGQFIKTVYGVGYRLEI